MAIQNRRGPYQDFDPTKMVEGEFAFVLSDDPAGANGQSVYASFENGSAKRLATYEDMADNIDQATSDIQQNLRSDINDAISDANTAVASMQSDINTAISDASDAVDGLESDVAGAITQAQTSMGTIQSDYQTLKSDNSNQLYNMQNSVNTAIDNIQGSASQAVAAADYAIEQADAVRQILEEGAVASFNGRTGAVVPQTNDYTSAQISHGTGSVFDALASKQNTLIQGNGINITNNVISADIGSLNIPDPHNVFYGGTITAQGQGILAAIGSAHNAIEITAGAVFDVQYPLLYAPDEIENLTTGTGDALGIYAIYGTATTPSDIASPVAYAPIYIVGTISGTSFMVDSTTPYTQALPNSEDGKVYMLVGNTGNSASSFVFSPSEKLFAYKGSAISVVTPYDLILKGVTDNIQTLLGNVTLPTTAQTVTGAIDELNSNKVSTSGDTMTGNLQMKSTAFPGVDETPSSIVGGLTELFLDKNGDRIGYLNTFANQNGYRIFEMVAERLVNGSAVTHGLQLGINTSGTRYVGVSERQPWLDALHLNLVVEQKSITGISISANGTTPKTISIAKSGYTPIGVVGWRSVGTTSFYAYQLLVSGTNLQAYFRNITSSAITNASYEVNVLYHQNA